MSPRGGRVVGRSSIAGLPEPDERLGEGLRALRGLTPYLWPRDSRDLRARVVLAVVLLVAGKLGLTRRDIPSVLTLFAPVRVREDGSFVWRPEFTHAGDYVDLRAEMDLWVGLSNSPHPLDPNPEYAPNPVSVTRFRAPSPAADDLCRTATAEAVRGFENNAFALALA